MLRLANLLLFIWEGYWHFLEDFRRKLGSRFNSVVKEKIIVSLKGVAKETLRILKEGKYITHSGKIVEFSAEQHAAVKGTILYTPDQAQALLTKQNVYDTAQPIIEVTDEKTQAAAGRLVQLEGCGDLVLLNYASARNPGGGFINGAKAQEEDLARCSGLYPCLLTQPAYYEANRNQDSLLYTDHVIYSPRVPWFRMRNRDLSENVFLASVITAPAPNAGQVLRRDSQAWPATEKALRHRAGIILAVARDNGHRSLLLGAWGCGVFRNRPDMVADAFGKWIADPRFRGCFDRIVFAVYSSGRNQDVRQAFQKRFQQV